MPKWNIMTYNLMIPVSPPFRMYGQAERAAKVHEVVKRAESDMKQTLDALIINELVPNDYVSQITKDLQELGFHYRSSALQKHIKLNGGIWIFSRIPIEKHFIKPFSNCTDLDCIITKGISYVKLVRPKSKDCMHLFGTHLQAWSKPEHVAVREKQVREMNQFIKDLKIPAKELITIMGDLNVEDGSQEHKNMLSILNMTSPKKHPKSHPHTMNPAQNSLAGVDSSTYYGCADVYKEKKVCTCCPKQWLDYALVKKKSIHSSSFMKSLPIQVAPFPMSYSFWESGESKDVSDHYPVWASILSK